MEAIRARIRKQSPHTVALRYMVCHNLVFLSLAPVVIKLQSLTIHRLLPVPPLAWPGSRQASPECSWELVPGLKQHSRQPPRADLSL